MRLMKIIHVSVGAACLRADFFAKESRVFTQRDHTEVRGSLALDLLGVNNFALCIAERSRRKEENNCDDFFLNASQKNSNKKNNKSS